MKSRWVITAFFLLLFSFSSSGMSIEERSRVYKGKKPIVKIVIFSDEKPQTFATLIKDYGINTPSLGNFGWIRKEEAMKDWNITEEGYEKLIKEIIPQNIKVIKENGGEAGGRQPHVWGIYKEYFIKNSRCTDWQGNRTLPCPASKFLREHILKACFFALDKFKFDHYRFLDELGHNLVFLGSHHEWCYSHKDKFIAFLKKKGYKPQDFNSHWKNWDELVMPTPENWRDSEGMRKLDYLFRLWKEEEYLGLLNYVCSSIKKKYPDIKLDVGIFTPLEIHHGFSPCPPLSRLREVKDGDYIEFDFYGSTYFGGRLEPKNYYIIEAMDEFVTDVSGMPLVVTKNLRYSWASPSYYRLITLITLLSTDNVIGINYYYYGVTPKGEDKPVRIGHPRLKAVGEAVKRAEKVYDLVHEFQDEHPILIIAEDPIHKGRGLIEKLGKGDREGYWRGMRRYRMEAYKKIAAVHRDSDFAIPRMIPSLTLSKYKVIIIDCQHMGEEAFNKILNWAKIKGNYLMVNTFPSLDQYDNDLTGERGMALAKVRAKNLPQSLEEVKKILDEALQESSVYKPLGIFPLVDIDCKVKKGKRDKLFLITNYGDKEQNFSFQVKGRGYHKETFFNTAKMEKVEKDNYTIIKGRINPKEMEVLLLD